MQQQLGSFMASDGTLIAVGNPNTLVPVMEGVEPQLRQPRIKEERPLKPIFDLKAPVIVDGALLD